jgi:hypothetical protein
MQFKDIIKGLLAGKSYCYTKKNVDDVHFFVSIANPINSEYEVISIMFFEDLSGPDDNDWDPEPLEVSREDLIHNSWREVSVADYYNENDDIHD